MLHNVNSLIGRIGGAATQRAGAPVSLPSSYVQSLPVYAGGGMPMPIGATGQDPALADPSLLSLQGLDQFKGIFDGLTAQPYDPSNPSPNPVSPEGYERDPYTPQGDRIAVPKAASAASTETRRRQPASLVRGADLLAEDEGQVDDMQRAEAAIKLLMQNM